MDIEHANDTPGTVDRMRMKNGENEWLKKACLLYTSKGASDGNFGTGTKTAVENFQKDNGLDVDGIAGAKTLEKLYTISGVTPIPDVTAAPGDILDLPG